MTIFELTFFLILVGIGIGVGSFVAKSLGVFAGIVIGILASIGFIYLTKFLGNVGHRRHCRKMAEKYTRIFRVLNLLADEKSVIKPKNSKIKVGDFGWESGPIRKNGLIYLKGFDEKWKMVWWAGFQLDQLEIVGPKPFSQYDIHLPDKQELRKTPCPFPVQPRSNSLDS
jgi:hypothetical protein